MEWTRDGRKGHGTYEDGNIFIQTVRKLFKKKNHLFFWLLLYSAYILNTRQMASLDSIFVNAYLFEACHFHKTNNISELFSLIH